jgi:hypothetical protein
MVLKMKMKNLDDVGGVHLRNTMKTMAIGEIKPMEDNDDSMVVIPPSSTINEEIQQNQLNDEIEDDLVQDISGHSIPPEASTSDFQITSRIHHSIIKDHPPNQIVGDISKGVQTRSRIASFCEHFSFVSCIEPNCVDEALLDVDWVKQCMRNSITLPVIKFGSLLKDQRITMSLEPSGYFETSIMKMVWW